MEHIKTYIVIINENIYNKDISLLKIKSPEKYNKIINLLSYKNSLMVNKIADLAMGFILLRVHK